jgi:branched-chain amino acid aminotransferase
MTSPLRFAVERSSAATDPERRAEILERPGFGQHFTDHMVLAHWTPDRGWHDARVTPYAPLLMDPASAVLHYSQEIFEGLKAYRHPDGSIWAFRPEVNAARFQGSARRLALPELPPRDFLGSIRALVEVDREWVPSGPEKSLYLRPFMYASEVFLGVRPARHVTYCLIASPAGAYFAKGVQPVTIWLSEDFVRSAPGGTGSAKCGGNYAASLLAQQEASDNGCDQVVFLDAVERRWVEELGGMNLFFVHDDGSLLTPELTDTILEGVTRASILELATALGHKVEERRVAVDEWREGVRSGRISEVFACGTAAVVTPVSSLRWRGGEAALGDRTGPVTSAVREALLDIQYGRAADPYGWMQRLG